MVTTETDIDLPGLLPLTLRRAYASGYARGQLFGPGWSSTLDQCLEIEERTIRYLGDDAQILTYPRPEQPGQPVLPTGGARWPLVWGADDVIRIEDPERGWTRQFPASPDPGRRPIGSLVDHNGNCVTYQRATATAFPNSCTPDDNGWRSRRRSPRPGSGSVHSDFSTGRTTGAGRSCASSPTTPAWRLTGVVNSSESRSNTRVRRAGSDHRLAGPGTAAEYHYVYDEAGRVVQGIGPNGCLSATLSYNRVRRVTTVTDALGQPTEYHYDRHMHVTKKTVDPIGGTVLTEQDRYGRLLSRTDEIGRTTRFTLDEQGDPVRVDRPDGTAVFVAYNAVRRPVRVIGPDGATWHYEYDQRGNVVSQTDPTGAVIRMSRGRHGELQELADPLGAVTRVRCDEAGLPVELTDPMQAVTRLRRDAFGHVIEHVDALGAATKLSWSGDGNLLTQSFPDGSQESWTYDAEDNLLAHRSAAGARTVFEYGPFNLPIRRTDPDGTTHAFTYDAELRLTAVTNPVGLTWRYRVRSRRAMLIRGDRTSTAPRGLLCPRSRRGELLARTNPVGERIQYCARRARPHGRSGTPARAHIQYKV